MIVTQTARSGKSFPLLNSSPFNPANLHRDTGDSGQPDTPLQIKAYRLTAGPWWACVDTFTGRSFGGRYSAREVDYIAAEFRDWPPKPIPPGVFGHVAEAAIRQSQGFCHIPSDKRDRWVGGAA